MCGDVKSTGGYADLEKKWILEISSMQWAIWESIKEDY